MSHGSAVLTPRHRLRLARSVVEEGWSVSAAAVFFRVSYPTAAKWVRRYVELGAEGMQHRSSRPHRHPNRTPQQLVRKIVHLRIKKRLGPVQIAGRLDVPTSTVHAVLVRRRLNRLSHVDVKTREPIRRYEHDKPGALIHVDVRSATSRRAAAGDSSDASKARRTVAPLRGSLATSITTRSSATRSSTPSSTTTPALPTPRSPTTKPQSPLSGPATRDILVR